MNWIVCVILYLCISVIFNLTYKVTTKSLTKAGSLTVLLQLIGALCALIMMPFFEMKFPTDIKVYIFLGIAIIFYAISDRLNTTVRSGIEASTFSIILQLSTCFMTILGFVFFKEPFILNKCIGAVLIILSNIFIFFKRGEGKINRYVILAIIANLFFTLALFFDVNLSDKFNLPMYVGYTLGVPAFLIMIFEKIKLSDIKIEFQNGNKKYIFLTSLTWALSIIFQLRAYQLGMVSIVAPLCALSVILNVFVGYIFLKERDDLVKKIISALLIILGIILIKI